MPLPRLRIQMVKMVNKHNLYVLVECHIIDRMVFMSNSMDHLLLFGCLESAAEAALIHVASWRNCRHRCRKNNQHPATFTLCCSHFEPPSTKATKFQSCHSHQKCHSASAILKQICNLEAAAALIRQLDWTLATTSTNHTTSRIFDHQLTQPPEFNHSQTQVQSFDSFAARQLQARLLSRNITCCRCQTLKEVQSKVKNKTQKKIYLQNKQLIAEC